MKHLLLLFLLLPIACQQRLTGTYDWALNKKQPGFYQIKLFSDHQLEHRIITSHFGQGTFTGTWQVKKDTLLLDYNLPPVKKHELIEKNIVGQIGKKLVIGVHSDSTLFLIVRVSINDQSHFQFSNLEGEVYLPDSIKLKKFEIREDISFEIKDSTANLFKVLLARPEPYLHGLLPRRLLIRRNKLVNSKYKNRKNWWFVKVRKKPEK